MLESIVMVISHSCPFLLFLWLYERAYLEEAEKIRDFPGIVVKAVKMIMRAYLRMHTHVQVH